MFLLHVISFVAIAFIFPVVLNENRFSKYSLNEEKDPYWLGEVTWNAKFDAKSWNGTWISGDAFYYEDIFLSLNLYNVTNRKSSPLLTRYRDLGDDISFISAITSLIPSPDLQYVLVRYEKKKIGQSTMVKYKIIKLDSKELLDVADEKFLQLAKWNVRGHSLAYVYGNDLYFLASPEDEPRRLTFDGILGELYNGVADWVYQEEVLGTDSALWFSPDGNYLAYLKVDDTQVSTYNYIKYAKSESLEDQYPSVEELKYPKAGTTNPTVSVFAVALNNSDNKPKKYQIPKNLELTDGIVFGLTWPTTEELSFLVTNRVQNKSWIIRCSLQNASCSEESSLIEPNGWILPNIPVYSSDGNRILDIQPAPEGNDTYYHLILTDLRKKNATRLTFGLRRVTKLLYWDESNNLAYYQSSIEGFPAKEHVFVVNTVLLKDACLTCNFSTPSGKCSHGEIDVSKDATYFTKICNGPGPDYVVITDSREAQPAITWEDNELLRSELEKKLQPIYRDLVVPVANGYNARVRVHFPPQVFSERQDKLYPTIVGVYAGPDFDVISDKYERSIKDYWTTYREYIYIQIDGRGSGRDGRNKMFQVYRKLGTVEIEDQINVTRYLQQFIPQIDSNHIGIYGAGYGGFAAAMALAKDKNDVFKFGIAVAPVTNFLYYDSIYTERYMGMPTKDDNWEGYKNTDIGFSTNNYIKDNSLLLMHGNADENVHYQHSAMFMRKLQLRSIQFQEMSYPDENSYLRAVAFHYFEALNRFIENQFKINK